MTEGREMMFRWSMLSEDVPLVHQRGEAIADLMDTLRSTGMVLLSSPTCHIRHGADPVMELTCQVRRASRAERRLLTPAQGVAA